MPEGFFFESTGSVCFAPENLLMYLLAYLNTPIADKINRMINPTLHLQSGDIAKLPVIVEKSENNQVSVYTEDNINLCKEDWDSFETSWDFTVHPLVSMSKGLWDATSTAAARVSATSGLSS